MVRYHWSVGTKISKVAEVHSIKVCKVRQHSMATSSSYPTTSAASYTVVYVYNCNTDELVHDYALNADEMAHDYICNTNADI